MGLFAILSEGEEAGTGSPVRWPAGINPDPAIEEVLTELTKLTE